MNISKASLICQNSTCGKNFNIVEQEQKFYDIKKLPPPEFCPSCRHRQRMALRSERKLYQRNCAKCNQRMLTTYPSEVPYKIYCQKCFWENIG